MKLLSRHSLLFLLALFSSFSQAQTPAPGCETVGNAEGICGFPAPEDIDVMPDGRHLLFSPYGGQSGEHPLPLYLFDKATQTASPIEYITEKPTERWDEGRCPSNPGTAIGGHGVHISQRENGQWQLLAVNHIRESVEFFEIVDQQDTPKLAWRGCVITPSKSSLNDLAALPGGGFLVTHMIERGTMDLMTAMASTTNTGFIWRWRPGRGFDKLPGSDGIIPNGVAVSADGRFVFFSETGGQRIRKIDAITGKELGKLVTGPSDNLSWSADGKLIATAATGAAPDDCFTKPGPCLLPFKVIAVDPQTLLVTTLHEQNGPPMGAASVAVRQDNSLYIGSFKGEQILKVTLSDPAL